MTRAIGVCLGASSVSFVKVHSADDNKIHINEAFSRYHSGDPKGVFRELMDDHNPEKLPVIVTGRKFRKLVRSNSIPEPEAVELAYNYIYTNQKFDAIASLGGETFMVYTLDGGGKIENVFTKNQCASGTGEFFLQQISRMNIETDRAVEIARDAEPYKVSGRCSVFCKSDCTHALNKGVPKGEVTAGLAKMIAEKVEELLRKTRGEHFLLTGGVTKNSAVMNYLLKEFPGAVIPAEASYFEALGAAIHGISADVSPYTNFDDFFHEKESSFVFHQPLSKYADKVKFNEIRKDEAKPGDRCILGLDVGSTTTKAVIIRESDDKILASVYLYTHGQPVEAAKKCYKELLEQIQEDIDIIGVGTTGSGRHIAGLHALTEGVFNEIIAHATAAVYFDPEVDTIFEIGGQDAKYTHIINKVPSDYAMNEACSAGTGSFIEESAWESLGVKVTDIEEIALGAAKPPNFSDQCAAFISSDIKTAQQENIGKADIIAGLVYSICLNYVNRVKGNRPVGNKIFMQGGVCYNKSIPIAMAALTGTEIIVPPEPGLMGAFGVALEVKEKMQLGLLHEKKYSLAELANRDVEYHKPFICPGGREKCDRKCPVNIIEVKGRKYPFGGACNKYYNISSNGKIDPEKYDYVEVRNKLAYEKFASDIELPEDAPTVGINKSFHTHTLFPLYHHFFSELGFRVILPDKVLDEGVEREQTALCFPGQISHGLFEDLLLKKPDYIFVPNVLEMDAEEKKYQRTDFNCTCIFVSGEPYLLKEAFREYNFEDKLISPIFNFGNGIESDKEKFYEIGVKLGIIDKNKIEKAFKKAVSKQNEYYSELKRIGAEFINFLDENPDEYAIVLVGRPYNAFAERANKGIPRKFASRGVYVLPYEMLDYSQETIDDDMYWEGGKKILRSAKVIKKHPNLFATYISNFSCAPDSILVTMFRRIMGTKPSLTLELDSHSADAGINTRIDAALDIIENYRMVSRKIRDRSNGEYRPAQVKMTEEGVRFIASDGSKVPLDSPRVDILLPSMGDLANRLFAAGIRSQGFNAIPLKQSNPDILKYGRSHATGKECLPLMLCTGLMIDYLENEWDGKQYVCFFIVQGAGNCRLGYYPTFMKNVIKDKKIPNVAMLELMHEEGFAGLGPKFSSRGIETLIASDVIDDIRSGIMAHAEDPEAGLEFFYNEFDKFVSIIEKDYGKFYPALKNFAKNIRDNIPAEKPIDDAKYIAMVGEMYVRRDPFAFKWLNRHFAEQGFILKDAYVSEWIFYVDYLLKEGYYEPLKSLKNKYERFVRISYMKMADYRIKKALEKSGYYKYYKTDVKPLVENGRHIVPPEFKGEPLLVAGAVLNDAAEKYCGVINIGPFGCMQSRFAEAVTAPNANLNRKLEIKQKNNMKYEIPKIFNGQRNIPFLSIETDGNVYPQVIEARLETFALQAERMAEMMKLSKNGHK